MCARVLGIQNAVAHNNTDLDGYFVQISPEDSERLRRISNCTNPECFDKRICGAAR
jgi:hypothetical protein